MGRVLFAALLLGGVAGCGFFNREPAPERGFYDVYAGWDIKYVPIIPPFRAVSTYPHHWSIAGASIHQDGARSGEIQVRSFGVSKSHIYGSTPGEERDQIGKWFLFNTADPLYAEYDTEQELTNTLAKFRLEKNPIHTCDEYFAKLPGERCYWFPAKGQPYPKFPIHRPDSCIEVQVTGDEKGIDFRVKGPIPKAESRIYFFRLKYEHKDNDLFYVCFDHSSPVLITNDIIVPAFAKGDAIGITVYTPYPVGQAKGIPEDKRIVLTKTFPLVAALQ